jgi:hypothetical protein
MRSFTAASIRFAVLSLAALVLTSARAPGQHVVGLTVVKNCPVFAAPGSVFQCTFTVQNVDPDHGVFNLSVVNEVPYPAGTTSAVDRIRFDEPTTVLGPAGTESDTCSGGLTETAPACQSVDSFFVDQIRATGLDEGTSQAVNGSTVAAVFIQACTPTPAPPTNTPTNTPTPVPPTNTPTNTPTPTPTMTPTPTSGPPLPTRVPTHAGRPTPKPTKTPRP